MQHTNEGNHGIQPRHSTKLIRIHPSKDCRFDVLEGFSNMTGTSVDNGARSKNTRKELGRLRRRFLTELWFSKEVRGDCPCSGMIYSLFFHFSKAVDW